MDMYIRGDAALKEIDGDNDILGVKVFAEKIAQSIFKRRKSVHAICRRGFCHRKVDLAA